MTERNFEPEHRIDMYQARCTNCGHIADEYGDFSAFGDVSSCIESLECNSFPWFVRYIRLPLPRTDVPNAVQLEIDELLCPDCQRCEVCGLGCAYAMDDHLVCADHEDHDFSKVAA